MNTRLLPAVPTGVEWLPIGLGESGDRVYRRSDGVAFAKVSDNANAARLDDERLRTEWLFRFAIGSPSVLDWSASELGACLVISTLTGVPASALSQRELQVAWPKIVGLVRVLHDLPVAGCPFERRLAGMFARAEEVVARGGVRSEFLTTDQKGTAPATLLQELRSELPERQAQEVLDLVVCHGDACLPNFIIEPDTLHCVGVVDLGRLGTADRYADLSLLIGNARTRWASTADADKAYRQLFEHYGTTSDERRLRFYLHLDPLTW